MSDAAERLTFVRFEGFVDPDRLIQFRDFVGDIATESTLFEELAFRDRDENGALLETLIGVEGMVTTADVLTCWSKQHNEPQTYNQRNLTYSRSRGLFDALYRHIKNAHNLTPDGNACACCLRGGMAIRAAESGGPKTVEYIEPSGLVTAYYAGQLDELPTGSSINPRKGLIDSTSFSFLAPYIEALTL